MAEQPPAGWYPDSTGASRWWDGAQWTEHTQAPPVEQTPAPVASTPNQTYAWPNVVQPTNTRAEAKANRAYAKATRPWYKKKRFMIPLVIVVLGIIGTAASGGSSSSDGPQKVADSKGSSSTGSDTSGSRAKPVNVGDTVKLEGTKYTVRSAKTASNVGDQFSTTKANGVYVVVELTIENTKNSTKQFSSGAATFIASNKKNYNTDDDGSFGVENPLIFEDMQPDVPKTGTLVFDVPRGKTKGGLLKVSDLFGRGDAYINLGLS